METIIFILVAIIVLSAIKVSPPTATSGELTLAAVSFAALEKAIAEVCHGSVKVKTTATEKKQF